MEFGLLAGSNALHACHRLTAGQRRPEQIRILQRLAEDGVAQLVHPVVGEQHQTVGLGEAQARFQMVQAFLDGRRRNGFLAAVDLLGNDHAEECGDGQPHQQGEDHRLLLEPQGDGGDVCGGAFCPDHGGVQ